MAWASLLWYPMTAGSRAQLITLLREPPDYLAGKTVDEKIEVLKTTSYRDYLLKICKVSEQVANFFQNRTHDFHGVGCDAVAAFDAKEDGYPGFSGLGLPNEGAEAVGEAADQAAATIGEAVDDNGKAVGEALDDARETAGDAAVKAGKAIQEAGEAVEEAGKAAKKKGDNT